MTDVKKYPVPENPRLSREERAVLDAVILMASYPGGEIDRLGELGLIDCDGEQYSPTEAGTAMGATDFVESYARDWRNDAAYLAGAVLGLIGQKDTVSDLDAYHREHAKDVLAGNPDTLVNEEGEPRDYREDATMLARVVVGFLGQRSDLCHNDAFLLRLAKDALAGQRVGGE